MNRSDEELLQDLRRGDQEAWSALYAAHRNELYSIACHLLQDDSKAEDVLHDVYVALAARAHALELQGSLRAYLATSCVNRCRDLLRRKTFEPASSDDLDTRTSGQHDPLQLAEARDAAQWASREIAALPLDQREVVALHLFGHLTFREIAEQMSISVNTIHSRYRYALDSLRSRLGASQGIHR